MLIPKNATVVVPVYALHHTHCTNPALYDPDRYRTNLKTAYQNASRPDYENRDHYAFGTGRRLCPGIHMGERTVWRMTAKILWAFEIKHAADAEGKEVVLDPDNYIAVQGTLCSEKPEARAGNPACCIECRRDLTAVGVDIKKVER
jgi:cytochrome P450